MRSVWIVLALTLAIWAGSDTVKKIDRSQKKLSQVKREKKETSRKLEKIAKDIEAARKELRYIEAQLAKLEKDRNATEADYVKLKKELQIAQRDLSEADRVLKQKRKRFIELLSERFSILFAAKNIHEPTRKNILEEAFYDAYKTHTLALLEKTKNELNRLEKHKKAKLAKRDATQRALDRIVKRKRTYEAQKARKEKLLKRLASDEKKYEAKLQKIIDRQNALRDTLAKLNIIRKKEVEEARRRAAARREAIRKAKERKRKLALARAKAKKAREALRRAKSEAERKAARKAVKEAEAERVKIAAAKDTIHSFNASYKPEKTYRYRGPKTISPVKGARVIKRFGTYVDPIYKLKIFNESVTLLAPRRGAKVRNVLNGKVVFKGKTSMLGNVVVVAHGGKMHTVYAGLYKIAPTIRKGKKIKKGYVVGRIERKLIFEVTKDTRHIDPLSLIRL